MESNNHVSSMIIYEDESVDVHYGNGSRLQLSPCGSEFLLAKAPEPFGHPLQTTEKIRQRTRFTISTYKEFLAAALVFRNKYASRPYLPEEVIAGEKKPFFSLDSGVQWPERSSCDAEFGPGGETIIRSAEGRAALTLSPSGEDFSVTFTCSLSQRHSQQHRVQHLRGDPDDQNQQPLSNQTCLRSKIVCAQIVNDETKEKGRRSFPTRSRSYSPPKPEQMYQSTTVVQHHSCSGVAPMWRYPLSLARQHWMTRFSKPTEIAEMDINTDCPLPDRGTNTMDQPCEGRMSDLPQVLPLTCSSPHWHRWKIEDPLDLQEHSEQELPLELVKVMWCHGVIYRILRGSVSVIEVSPGDGSIIRSNGVLNAYFTHHKPELLAGEVKVLTYYLNNLPPDVPGQLYSVNTIVTRASRILACYNEAKQSMKLNLTPSCLQQDQHFSEPVILEDNLPNSAPTDSQWNITESVHSQSDLVTAELEKIKRFTFLLENSNLSMRIKRSSSQEGPPIEPVNETYIAEALHRTSKAIHDIDALVSATTLT